MFQTRHPAGWAYGGGSRGSDVGIVRDGGIFNYRQFSGMSVYGNNCEVTARRSFRSSRDRVVP
ncbi:MAG TPA: hypothetical protein VFZ09_03905 [Archangium sp.]|uniref:hypothetical protein n=1 Tax=Archangium sp. TaxID=1872627 RepID=UPI002E2FD593|nr:hypothetical protein [Archangium sp.]HEX5745363.1 hypothetical protein [Archangium sp.]